MEILPQTAQEKVLPIIAACPACGLLCDDIFIDNSQANIRVLANSCAKSIRFFEQPIGNISPQINGKPATLQQAISYAAELLKASEKPLFAGLSTDVQGYRAVYNLAQKINQKNNCAYQSRLQHMNSQSMARNMAVLQSTGWQTTTLTEVKNRADVIVCIGTDIVSQNPRFFERFVWLNNQNSNAMFTDAHARQIIYIGEHLNINAGVSPDGRQPTSIDCRNADLPEILAVLRALMAGKKLKAQTVAGINIGDLIAVADKLKQAKYAVLAWIAKDLDFAHAELSIQSITETVALLNNQDNNQTGRAAGLSLGGSDGDTSANNANTWLSGYSLNNQQNAHDLVVWVNSFSPEKLPEKTDKPLIVLGNANTKFAQIPDLFIPIATPGLDCSGTLFRVDSAVVLPLKKVRENNFATLNDVARQIEALLS